MPTPAHHVGGLAISETHDAILYSASDFSGGAPDNWLLVAPLDSPCTPDCRLQVLDCFGTSLGPITGLAFDDCTSTVYATDGRVTLSTRFVLRCRWTTRPGCRWNTDGRLPEAAVPPG